MFVGVRLMIGTGGAGGGRCVGEACCVWGWESPLQMCVWGGQGAGVVVAVVDIYMDING